MSTLRLPKIHQRTRHNSRKTPTRRPHPSPNNARITESSPTLIDLDLGIGGFSVENEFTRFSPACTFPRLVDRNNFGVSVIRSQRLFNLTKQLRKCHDEYNKLHSMEERDKFMKNEILQRYVMALDLALTGGYNGIALEILHGMYDATKCMVPLYSKLFYRLDGTHAPLPIPLSAGGNYIKALGPVIYSLNRIPASSATPDNSQLRLETHLMKLQLEILMLVISPVESMIFRATLEVVPSTAFTAYKRLAAREPGPPVIWEHNNSQMKREYVQILEKFGLADQLGCKGSLITVNPTMPTKSSRKVNCDSELEMSGDDESDSVLRR